MSGRLHWRAEGEALRFHTTAAETTLPVERWAGENVCLHDGRTAHLGILLAMADAEIATVAPSGDAILAPAREIAGLQAWEAAGLGLPGPAPFRLRLDRQGLITDPGFSGETVLCRDIL